jgi:uroporphyrinogen-III decarboxylase
MMDYIQTINNLVTNCADQAKKLAQENANNGNLEALYLYYKPSTEWEHGHLLMVPDSKKQPEGYILATGAGLKCNVAFSYYWQWIKDNSSRLPILAWGTNKLFA